jgi:hypothetical protein
LALAAGSAIAKENEQQGLRGSLTRDLELAFITGFTLMDTSGDKVSEIGEVRMRDLFDLAETGKSLSLCVDIKGHVGSVTFTHRADDDFEHTETVIPFAMGGNVGDNWNSVDYLYTPGVKVVFAETEAGYSTYISFAIMDSTPTDEPTPSPTEAPRSYITGFTLIDTDSDT